MVFSFEILIFVLLIALIMFFLLSIIIREVAEIIMKQQNNTIIKSAEPAFVVIAIFVLQYFVSAIPILGWLLNIVAVILLYFMLKRLYNLNYLDAFIMTLAVVIIFILVLAVITIPLALF